VASENDKTEIRIEGVSFDFSAVTVQDWAEWVDVAGNMTLPLLKRVELQAKLLVKVVTALPEDWGDPQDVKTYTAMPFFSHYEPLINAVWVAVGDVRKKVNAQYTTA
jgi:hypothetical protein